MLQLLGEQALLQAPVGRDVLSDAEHADHKLVGVIPVRVPEVAQPAARPVTGADAVLGAGFLAALLMAVPAAGDEPAAAPA